MHVLCKCPVGFRMWDYCLFWSFFKAWSGGGEGGLIVVTAFYSSGLHGELFDVFINLRHARLEAAGWLLDLGAPWLLHLTCAPESSITCPAWGQDDWWDTLQPWRRLSCIFQLRVCRGNSSVTCIRELFALINKSGHVWKWQMRECEYDHKKQKKVFWWVFLFSLWHFHM